MYFYASFDCEIFPFPTWGEQFHLVNKHCTKSGDEKTVIEYLNKKIIIHLTAGGSVQSERLPAQQQPVLPVFIGSTLSYPNKPVINSSYSPSISL